LKLSTIQILQSTEWLKFIPLLSKLSVPEKKTAQFQVAFNEGNIFFWGRWASSLEDVKIGLTWMIIVNIPKFIHPSPFHAIFRSCLIKGSNILFFYFFQKRQKGGGDDFMAL
jgi:hypothetical protein